MAHVIATHEGEFTCPWFGTKFSEGPHTTPEGGVVLCGHADVTDEAALARYAADERFIVQGWESKAPAETGAPEDTAPPADAIEKPAKKGKK